MIGVTMVKYNPLYLQVKDELVKRISNGTYGIGDAIPTEAALAAEFGTSVSTIRQAVAILVSEKLLDRKQGKGTFVIKTVIKDSQRSKDRK
jgi:DNA-binding GntR family transcriptional regulator